MHLSSLVKPKNWIKLLNDPKKGFEVIYKIISDYPRIQNFTKIKSKIIRNIIFSFYKYFVQKNNSLKSYFIESSKGNNNIYFNKDDFEKNIHKIFNSLADNGIVVIKNILDKNEKNKIDEYFDELHINKISTKWINDEIIDASGIKYKDSKRVQIKCLHKELKYMPQLGNIIKIITKNIFGKNVDSFAEFYLHDSLVDFEKPGEYEDTFFHTDRYMPCLKIFYSPNSITEIDGPFSFIKGTHKLNNRLMKDFFMNTDSFMIDSNKLSKNLSDHEEVKATCNENSLVIAFTNGLHKRNVFLKKNISRKTVFFQFTKNFNKLSLLNFKRYNS